MRKRKTVRARNTVLRYASGKRNNATARRHYLQWRAEQVPPLPERCDNEVCRFHSEPLVWNGNVLPLMLEHRNGVNSDNRPSNLRLLCPNCDSQNFGTRGGANAGRVIKSAGGFAIERPDGTRDYTMPAESGRYALGGN